MLDDSTKTRNAQEMPIMMIDANDAVGCRESLRGRCHTAIGWECLSRVDSYQGNAIVVG